MPHLVSSSCNPSLSREPDSVKPAPFQESSYSVNQVWRTPQRTNECDGPGGPQPGLMTVDEIVQVFVHPYTDSSFNPSQFVATHNFPNFVTLFLEH